MHGERLQVHVRGDRDDAGKLGDALAQVGIIGLLRRAFIDDARVRGQGQQAIAQLALEAVHDREHHDQRRHAQRNAGERHPGDEGHEEGVLAGAHVAQTHKH